MKILVTGHKGFIGQHLTKKLGELGYEWHGFDLKDHHDIRNEIDIDMAIRQIGEGGIVIHLAALAGVREGEKRPSEYLSTNVIGTQNVINACKQWKIGHLISFSSSSVLGNQTPHVTGSLETDPMAPIAVYGISKMCGEHLVKHSGLDASIIRPFTVYGENGRPEQVVYKWINCIKAGQPIPFFGDGNTKRGYTYVGDLVDGLVKLIHEAGDWKGCQVFNMGGSEVISLNDLYEIFTSVVGEVERDVQNLPNGDVTKNWADVGKAHNAFGFTASTPFANKVKEIISKEIKV